jgi:hypothetical protein
LKKSTKNGGNWSQIWSQDFNHPIPVPVAFFSIHRDRCRDLGKVTAVVIARSNNRDRHNPDCRISPIANRFFAWRNMKRESHRRQVYIDRYDGIPLTNKEKSYNGKRDGIWNSNFSTEINTTISSITCNRYIRLCIFHRDNVPIYNNIYQHIQKQLTGGYIRKAKLVGDN